MWIIPARWSNRELLSWELRLLLDAQRVAALIVPAVLWYERHGSGVIGPGRSKSAFYRRAPSASTSPSVTARHIASDSAES